jgi:hypothetical protein
MIRRVARALTTRDREDGYVLPVVMAVGMLMLVLVATSLTVASSGYTKASRDADWNAALSAAYGGLSEYQSRLANDSSYTKYGNKDAPFTKAALGSVVSLPTGDAVNPAFAITVGGTWANVPGSDQRATFRYEVDNSDYAAKGSLRLRVTGKVGTSTRSIVAELRQSGFLNYVYFSDYEIFDPAFSGDSASCVRYAYAGRPSGCTEIQFGSDYINGPVHSNDRIRACDTTFTGLVTSAAPSTPVLQADCGANTYKAGTPKSVQSLPVPASNSEMKKETRSDLSADVPNPGCLYTGPTSVTYNSDGTMTIQSPWTKYTQTTGSNSGSTPSQCGSISALASSAGATIPVLASNLIYIQNVPAAGSSDPNAWSASATPTGFKCTAADTKAFDRKNDDPNNGSPDGWTFQNTRYPAANEAVPNFSSSANPAYGCRNGDVFIRGQVKGATTVAAENYVYVTGDITYVDKTRDMLGIVGNNAVIVWNPRTRNGLVDTSANRTINASIMSVAHTFTVQNYGIAPRRGTLTVLGAIAQRFRGPVAQNGGYTKSYNYDDRLKSATPPKFITPVSTTYDVSRVGGVDAAFNADGSAR